jgi:5-methylcytosine-specific restriction endonuclease McrA
MPNSPATFQIGRTEAALLARGIDRRSAVRIASAGWTLKQLQQANAKALAPLRLTKDQRAKISSGDRSSIPPATLVAVLFRNRFLCCVCRDPTQSIVVHHIRPWAETQDHSAPNLAVVCLRCHGKAHTTHQLALNLTAQKLRSLKKAWEKQVEKLDQLAILEASRIHYAAWNYFNHLRLLELARELKVRLNKLPSFQSAFSVGAIDSMGTVMRPASGLNIYAGAAGQIQYAYMKEMMEEVLSRIRVNNISDFFDKGVLINMVAAGDYIYVQGAHNFSNPHDGAPAGSASKGRRTANGVEVEFVFDQRESTSVSALSVWLTGHKVAGSLLQVRAITRVGTKVQIEGTVLGICAPLDGLKSRDYDTKLAESGLMYRDHFYDIG